MNVSVVIRALNEEAHIGRLLTGLSRQTRPVDEVVLVDSGSTDATVEIAGRFGAKIVHIDPEEFSFGRALNRGIEATSGELIVIPSAHVFPVHDEWISGLIGPFTDEGVGLAYGRQVGDLVTKYSEHRVLARWFPETSDSDQQHPFCNNANAAVRRSIWMDYGYDERLTGLEDIDLARRIQVDGWRIAYVAEAVVAHVHDETWQQIMNRYRREAIAHRRIFHDQQMSLAETVKLITLNVLGDARDALREGALAPNLRDIVQFRMAQFIGTYQGFRQSGPITEEMKRRFFYPGIRRPAAPPKVFGGQPIDYGQHANSDE